MTRTRLFAYLGAPFTNPRWSWGAVRERDDAVFLLVWQDENKRIGGKSYTCVNAASFFGEESSNLGHAERLRHVEFIRAGAPAYMIMCMAVDPKAAPRTIASFNEREVFVGGKLIEADGDWWLERVARRPIDTVS
jgi:hypothetical protein